MVQSETYPSRQPERPTARLLGSRRASPICAALRATLAAKAWQTLQGPRCSISGVRIIRNAMSEMSMKFSVALVCIALFSSSGCAWQSDALKLGDDKYQVSANASPARGGVTGARQMALANANKKCDSLGKEIEVLDIQTEHAFPANGVATVTFVCK